MTELYAQPYSIEHTGFYFDNIEKFESGMERLNKRGCEEVEIQFIDGDSDQVRLFKATNIDQSMLSLWFDELENLATDDTTRMCFLLDYGHSLEDALSKYDEVYLHFGTAEDYAQDIFEETMEIPENLQNYIDYEAVARDMRMNGEIIEIERELLITNAYEF